MPSTATVSTASRCCGSPRGALRATRQRSGTHWPLVTVSAKSGEGVDTLRVGILPTPAVAYLAGAYDADFGVMISASHNPAPDNGIKIFGPGGHKLDDATEDRIEDLVNAKVLEDAPIVTEVLSMDDAKKRGAMMIATAVAR